MSTSESEVKRNRYRAVIHKQEVISERIYGKQHDIMDYRKGKNEYDIMRYHKVTN